MFDATGFRSWLVENKPYSDKVISDIVSRMRRSDGIIPWSDEEFYQVRLERNEVYAALSVSVRSQCKRAVKLYSEYVKSAENTDSN